MSSFSGGDDGPNAAEIAVVAVSVLVTLSLFGYVGWHARTTPADAPPTASVDGTRTTDDGRTLVRVAVTNPASTGLESVTVTADCADGSVTFQHVPTDARATGTLVCPASADDPSASIRSWITSKGTRTN